MNWRAWVNSGADCLSPSKDSRLPVGSCAGNQAFKMLRDQLVIRQRPATAHRFLAILRVDDVPLCRRIAAALYVKTTVQHISQEIMTDNFGRRLVIITTVVLVKRAIFSGWKGDRV